jgi:hypothetical protein
MDAVWLTQIGSDGGHNESSETAGAAIANRTPRCREVIKVTAFANRLNPSSHIRGDIARTHTSSTRRLSELNRTPMRATQALYNGAI